MTVQEVALCQNAPGLSATSLFLQCLVDSIQQLFQQQQLEWQLAVILHQVNQLELLKVTA
jgi:hypothetical protein